ARLADALGPITNPNMASDLQASQALAQAAISAALANVEINLGSLGDQDFARDLRKKAEALRT
ncbi:MAG: cyclodeaminase/cyclohydrolase family protein, partial [Terriglobales bacterium]